jgi:hypothetical protein
VSLVVVGEFLCERFLFCPFNLPASSSRPVKSTTPPAILKSQLNRTCGIRTPCIIAGSRGFRVRSGKVHVVSRNVAVGVELSIRQDGQATPIGSINTDFTNPVTTPRWLLVVGDSRALPDTF